MPNPRTLTQPPDYETDTVTATLTQVGFRTLAGGWLEPATPSMTLSAGAQFGGITVDLWTEFAAARFHDAPGEELPLDPPRPLAIRVSLTSDATFPGPSNVTISMVPEQTPALYSAALLPTNRSEVNVIGAGTTEAVMALPAAGTATASLDMAVVRPTIQHGNWRGRLALTFVGDNVAPMLVVSPTVTVDQWPFHTGSSAFPHNRRARVVRDHIGGFPYLSDEAVPDGFRDGIMVSPDSWDPEDRVPSYVPPASEGVVDDEIPD